jgi:hypothetical protein
MMRYFRRAAIFVAQALRAGLQFSFNDIGFLALVGGGLLVLAGGLALQDLGARQLFEPVLGPDDVNSCATGLMSRACVKTALALLPSSPTFYAALSFTVLAGAVFLCWLHETKYLIAVRPDAAHLFEECSVASNTARRACAMLVPSIAPAFWLAAIYLQRPDEGGLTLALIQSGRALAAIQPSHASLGALLGFLLNAAWIYLFCES